MTNEKDYINFLMAIFIMVGCTSKEKEITFSKTSQDIWGEIIINDTDKITIPTTLKQLGKDYSLSDVKVKGDGYVGTGLKKDGYQNIEVIVNEEKNDDVNMNSVIMQLFLPSSLETSVTVCGIKIGDSNKHEKSMLGAPDYILASKSDIGKEHWYYYGEQNKELQYLRIVINKNGNVERFEILYLPEEYLNKE